MRQFLQAKHSICLSVTSLLTKEKNNLLLCHSQVRQQSLQGYKEVDSQLLLTRSLRRQQSLFVFI